MYAECLKCAAFFFLLFLEVILFIILTILEVQSKALETRVAVSLASSWYKQPSACFFFTATAGRHVCASEPNRVQ